MTLGNSVSLKFCLNPAGGLSCGIGESVDVRDDCARTVRHQERNRDEQQKYGVDEDAKSPVRLTAGCRHWRCTPSFFPSVSCCGVSVVLVVQTLDCGYQDAGVEGLRQVFVKAGNQSSIAIGGCGICGQDHT